jgi:hypothetical protein
MCRTTYNRYLRNYRLGKLDREGLLAALRDKGASKSQVGRARGMMIWVSSGSAA